MALQLIQKIHLTDNVWSFRFKPSESFTWEAGQFIRVELPHDHPDAEGTKRWFTVSAPPFEGVVQITTRVTKSTFKQALSKLPIGGELQLLEKPDGDFVWVDTDKPMVFIAGGIGITPFHSILAQRAHEGRPLAITLIYSNRTDAIAFKDEFDAMAQKDPRLKIHYVIGERMTPQKLASLDPQLNDSLVYLSGPEPMVEALGDQLRAAGLADAQLKQDFFPNYTEQNY